MRVDAFLFDCDGVLVDTEIISNTILCEMANEIGVPLSLSETISRFQGHALSRVFKDFESELGHSIPTSFESDFRRRTFEAFQESLKPIPGAPEIVSVWTGPKAVVSNGPGFKMDLTLKITGLKRYFTNHIYSAYDIGKWKPDPSLFLHAAEKLQVKPQRSVVIEDSLAGIEASRAGGFISVALAKDYNWEQMKEKADLIFKSHFEIMQYFGLGI